MIGKEVSHYRILEELGRGGMGIVYRAEDTRLKRTVALKFLPTELTQDQDANARFVQEAQAASSLQHTNICTIHDIDESSDGHLFIVMDCYEGQSLKERISRGPLTIEEAIAVARHIAQGLQKAHEREIIHRDIKPANIFVGDDGTVRILDFGLAKLAGTQTKLTRTGTTLGTAAYMSPEQARGEDVDARTDVWSLGVVLYEMLTGKPPFQTEYQTALLYSILNDSPTPPRALRAEVPPGLERVVLRALQKDPAARYQRCAEFLDALDKETSPRPVVSWLRKPSFVVPGVVVLIGAILGGYWIVDRNARANRARREVFPALRQAIGRGAYGLSSYETYLRLKEASEILEEDQEFKALWSELTTSVNVTTTPPGALVLYRQYGTPETTWYSLGETPIADAEFPRGFFEWRVEKEGFEPLRFAALSIVWDDSLACIVGSDVHRDLDPAGSLPQGMVKVDHDTTLGPFFIDRYEVTNREFREFVRAGGYENPAYWQQPFVKEGRPISWRDAVEAFVDLTGRPGPATWRAGDFPDGEETYPVTGISWYEAAAYAAYVGKKLPTTEHWSAATGWDIGSNWYFTHNLIIPHSNFSGTGLRPVGSGGIPGPCGLYDLAGNAREWCWNRTDQGRSLRGGAWNDATYMYSNISQAFSLDRSSKNGFRCMLLPETSPRPEDVWEPIRYTEPQDLYAAPRLSDEVVQVYRQLFSYDATALHPRIEFADSVAADWTMASVSFSGPRAAERMTALVFLPRTASPPYQTVVYFPGAAAARGLHSRELAAQPEFKMNLEFLLKGGRAVCVPVCISMYERFLPDSVWDAMGPHEYANYRIRLVQEFRRTLDYLASRPDIDSTRFGYLGFSWGGHYANLLLAVEPRFRAAVLKVGGLRLIADQRPEIQFINYVRHIHTPVLMLNGEYDLTFPLEIAVRPMFELLGAPREDKRLVVYPTDHFIPSDEYIKETLDWLDRYLGPVRH